ncbi:hypothetical protein VULLAG_LOCUS11979 [Vulpes lagopus]
MDRAQHRAHSQGHQSRRAWNLAAFGLQRQSAGNLRSEEVAGEDGTDHQAEVKVPGELLKGQLQTGDSAAGLTFCGMMLAHLIP